MKFHSVLEEETAHLSPFNRPLFKQKIRNQLLIKLLRIIFVVPPGIEPGTHGFSVRCSTN